MHWHLKQVSLCALTVLATACVPAHAAMSSSTASIDQFQFRLVDLDLNDGITPSLQFTLVESALASQGGGRRELLSAAGSTSIVTQVGAASGTVSDTALRLGASMNHPLPRDGVYQTYRNDASYSAEFTLSPNTEMVFSAVGTLSQHVEEYFDNASTHISMQANLLGTDVPWPNYFVKAYDIYGGNAAATVNLYGSLMSDDQVRKGRFSLNAITVLSGPVTTVPEPSTWAMLLAGAFIVGAIGRRRAAAAAPAGAAAAAAGAA